MLRRDIHVATGVNAMPGGLAGDVRMTILDLFEWNEINYNIRSVLSADFTQTESASNQNVWARKLTQSQQGN